MTVFAAIPPLRQLVSHGCRRSDAHSQFW